MTRPEFSRRLRLPAETKRVALVASPVECAALAERFAILGIAALQAELTLVPETGGAIRARGSLAARVTQACVVTLEPVEQDVAAPLDLVILPEGTLPTDDDPDSPDEIESEGGFVDLGEAVAEQLALALDPYPRAPDAVLPDFDDEAAPQAGTAPEAAPEPPRRPNPFAGLARLKRG